MIDHNIHALSEELQKMQERMKSFELSEDCDTIYLLGATGSGKSTTVNYFLKKGPLPLENDRGRYQIESIKGGPQIGHTNTSCTEIPTIYKDPDGDKIYIDPAGFMDTKGPLQETINGLCNALMFEKGVQTKIILVIEYSTITTGRGSSLVEIAKRLFDLFGIDFDRIINSIIILVTKVNIEEIKIEYIVDDIKNIALKNKNMNEPLKVMIASIIKNNNVFMLPLPKHVNQDTIANLINAIDKTIPTTLSRQANISLSFEAKGMIHDLGSLISQEVSSCIKSILYEIQSMFLIEIQSQRQQLQKVISQLKITLTALNKQSQQNWVAVFFDFAKQIQLKDTLINKFMKTIDEIRVFQKFNFPIKLNLQQIQTIPMCLSGILSKMQNEMAKRMTQQQIKEISDRYQKALSQRTQQLEMRMSQWNQQAKEREERLQEKIKKQKKFSKDMIANSSLNHQQQMSRLNEKIEALEKKNSSFAGVGANLLGALVNAVSTYWLKNKTGS